MKRIKRIDILMLAYSLIAIACGILMYTIPEKVIGKVGYVMAAEILIFAIKFLMEYKKKEAIKSYYCVKFLFGIFFIISAFAVGIWANMIKRFLIYIIGMLLCFGALIRIETAYHLKMLREHSLYELIFAAFWFFVGMMVMQIPMNVSDFGDYKEIGEKATMILGIIFTLNGFLTMLYALFVKPKIKED